MFALLVVGFVEITRVHAEVVHPVSLGSLGFALGVVGFIRDLFVHSGSRWGSLGTL